VKILVTGGAGYIGGTVAELLTRNGHQAVVFDNLSHGRRDLLPAGVEFVEGELADRQGLENLFISAKKLGSPFDGVLHFAALIEAGESMVHPEQFFRNNTASTLSLLEAILAHGPRRLVFSSTAAVYGEPEIVPIKEDARLLPTNAYGASKLLVEQMLGWFHQIHGLRSAALRYFNVAGAPEGPGGVIRGEAHDPESHLIPLVLDVALGRRKSIKIFGEDYPTPERASASARLSNRHAGSLAIQSPLRSARAEPETLPSWWLVPRRLFANWAGSLDTRSSTRLFEQHGSGIRSGTLELRFVICGSCPSRIPPDRVFRSP